MFKPTPAERKTMISKLPPASEGKVWKRLTEGKMRAGDHTFCVASGIHYIGEITVGAPFDGAPVSKLENYQSAWRLVAARKRPAKPASKPSPEGKTLPAGVPALPKGYVYLGRGEEFKTKGPFKGLAYATNVPPQPKWNSGGPWNGGSCDNLYAAPVNSEVAKLNGLGTIYYRLTKEPRDWVAKACGDTDYTYRSSGNLQIDGNNIWTEHTKATLKSGTYTKITRAEFLDTIKGYGLNEDGTKIVPPPKVRFFKHVDGFGDPLLFVALRPDETHYFIYKDREVVEAKDKYWTKARCEEAVKDGNWIEVFQPEVDAALAPKPHPKTELELTKEALTAANARIATLEAKIASAKEALS